MQIPHDEVGTSGFSPVIVERNDVRVLHPRNELGLSVEPANELRIVRRPWMDDLDRDLPPCLRLEGAVDGAEGSRAQELVESVAAERLTP
jgi:hypothetical protein